MKTWFITGASRGFGAKVAAIALARGDRVVATARNPEDVARRLDDHPSLLALALDVTNEAQAREAAAAAVARFGRIDVLLNNAGYGLMGAVEEASADEVEGVNRTNVFGLLNVTRAVLPYMHARRSGRVLNILSIGGYRGAAGFGVYSSTKFAVEGLSEALHTELAPLGVHVQSSSPATSAPTSWTPLRCRSAPRASTTTTARPARCARWPRALTTPSRATLTDWPRS